MAKVSWNRTWSIKMRKKSRGKGKEQERQEENRSVISSVRQTDFAADPDLRGDRRPPRNLMSQSVPPVRDAAAY